MTDTEKRDITKRLATEIMGWRYWDGQDDLPLTMETMFTDLGGDMDPPVTIMAVYENGSDDVTRWWQPLNDLADAWMLVEALNKRDYIVTCVLSDTAECEVYRCGHSDAAEAATMPLAISLAAIAVLDAGGAS